jgi:orotate phosphoribosyltransferase
MRDGLPLPLSERNSMFDRDALIKVFQERALKFGDFTLVSGKKSSYYLDGKQVMLHAQGLRLVSEGLLDLLSDVEFDAIGGMSIGADPIIGGVLTVAAEQNREMIGVMVRKEAKGHGTQKFIEGPLQPGMKVVVVDDVVTTGGSSLDAAKRIQDFGAEVVEVVGIVDRMQGGAETFAKHNLPFRSLLSILDFGIEPPAAE